MCKTVQGRLIVNLKSFAAIDWLRHFNARGCDDSDDQKRRRKNPRKNYSKLLIKKLRKSEGVDQTKLLKYSYFQRNTSNVQFLTDSGRIAMICSVCWVVNHVLYFFCTGANSKR